jgi:hypothetical protein
MPREGLAGRVRYIEKYRNMPSLTTPGDPLAKARVHRIARRNPSHDHHPPRFFAILPTLPQVDPPAIFLPCLTACGIVRIRRIRRQPSLFTALQEPLGLRLNFKRALGGLKGLQTIRPELGPWREKRVANFRLFI